MTFENHPSKCRFCFSEGSACPDAATAGKSRALIQPGGGGGLHSSRCGLWHPRPTSSNAIRVTDQTKEMLRVYTGSMCTRDCWETFVYRDHFGGYINRNACTKVAERKHRFAHLKQEKIRPQNGNANDSASSITQEDDSSKIPLKASEQLFAHPSASLTPSAP